MDMCLAEVIGQKPTAANRPRMDALSAWLVGRSLPGDRVEACVFANVGQGQEPTMARWVANLRQWGWSVFVKPKQHRRDDIDDEMVGHIEHRFRQGALVEVIVASHDSRAFSGPLARYAQAGVDVTVLGYRERAAVAAGDGGVRFLDAEAVPGMFEAPLPRTNLFDLPRRGRWFDPFVELGPEGAAGPDATANGSASTGAPASTGSGPPDGAGRRQTDGSDVASGAADRSAAAETTTRAGAEPTAVQDAAGEGTAGEGTAGEGTAGGATGGGATAGDATAGGAPAVGADQTAGGGRIDRLAVVAAVHAAVLTGPADGRSLHDVGVLLRNRFPGFSLDAAGYDSVTELLDEVRASGEVTVTRSEDGHVLSPATASLLDAPGAGRLGDGEGGRDDAGGRSEDRVDGAEAGAPATGVDLRTPAGATGDPTLAGVIDLVALDPAPAVLDATPEHGVHDGAAPLDRRALEAGARPWPTAAEVADANPIYRMFGFDPNGA